jgi:hypothetical protein
LCASETKNHPIDQKSWWNHHDHWARHHQNSKIIRAGRRQSTGMICETSTNTERPRCYRSVRGFFKVKLYNLRLEKAAIARLRPILEKCKELYTRSKNPNLPGDMPRTIF